MGEATENDRSRSNYWWLLILPTALALYALSLGPAAYIYRHSSSGVRDIIETVYTPLLWALRSPVGYALHMHKVVDWYIGLWV